MVLDAPEKGSRVTWKAATERRLPSKAATGLAAFSRARARVAQLAEWQPYTNYPISLSLFKACQWQPLGKHAMAAFDLRIGTTSKAAKAATKLTAREAAMVLGLRTSKDLLPPYPPGHFRVLGGGSQSLGGLGTLTVPTSRAIYTRQD